MIYIIIALAIILFIFHKQIKKIRPGGVVRIKQNHNYHPFKINEIVRIDKSLGNGVYSAEQYSIYDRSSSIWYLHEKDIEAVGFFKKIYITRSDGKIYLIRWTLFTCKYFSLKVHKFLLSDDNISHDHPWDFVTFIIRGGYIEYIPTFMGSYFPAEFNPEKSKIHHPGDILYRPAKWIHRIEVHQTCWTFVITLRKKQSWGFYTVDGFKEFQN